MSKSALGRGLGSLLNSPERNNRALPANDSTSSPDPAGVQLLLSGFIAEHITNQREREHERAMAGHFELLHLAVPLLWVADAVMVAVAAWAVLSVHQPIRFLIATILIMVGGLLGCLAAWLNWPPVAEVPIEVASEEEAPRIRIRFMNDRPTFGPTPRSDSRQKI
ncbi:MAG: hypothetical protein EXS36_06235 [Pedosphaera sp.]|nr:hypothetical protein [Pedosphaera sp.]